MKKIKTLLVALTSASLLASCGGKAQWKQYNIKRTLSEHEKDALIAKVEAATFAKLNKYEYEYVDQYKTALRNEINEEKHVYEQYQKGQHYLEESIKEHDEVNGHVEEKSYVRKTSRALFDEENFKYAKSVEDDLSGTYAYSEEATVEAFVEGDVMNALESVFVSLTDINMFACETKKGEFFFINSDESEEYTTEAYGHYQKVKHTIERDQRVALLNEDFSLKTLTYTHEYQSNKDMDTQEFYKKAKLQESESSVYKFFYGDRADGSAKLANLKANAKEGYRLSASPEVKGVALKEDGTEISEAPFSEVDRKQVAFNKYHYNFRIDNVLPSILEQDVAKLRVKLAANSVSNAKEDPVATEMDVQINSFAAGNSGLILEGNDVKMGKAPVSIGIEFDLEVASDGGISLSNVNAVAELYIEI